MSVRTCSGQGNGLGLKVDTFNIVAGIASICGLLASGLAAFLACRAKKAADGARDAARVRSLADELELACSRAEQLLDFLQHGRLSEASLRVNELTSCLSELPHRRSPFLPVNRQNVLLNSRCQLQTVGEAILTSEHRKDGLDKEQLIKVTRRVVMGLREVLGGVRSHIESGDA